MTTPLSADVAATKAAEIVVAFLSGRAIEAADLPLLVRQVVQALHGGQTPSNDESVPAETEEAPSPDQDAAQEAPSRPRLAAVPAPTPALPVSESVTAECIYSLEDGKPYRSLRRHLMAKYQMTPDDYRRKWGLPADYPMVAPSYAQQRSEVAKRSGLGTKRGKPPVRSRTKSRQA